MPGGKGFNSASNGYLAPAPVVAKTKCKRCCKSKSIDDFSNKQQKDLASKMRLAGSSISAKEGHLKQGWIVCKGCTSQQNSEMECVLCDVWKPLDAFSKNHRGSDEPKCKECMTRKVKLQPDEPIREDDDDSDTASSASNPHAEDDISEVTSSINGMGINRSTHATASTTADDDEWVDQGRSNLSTSSRYAGFDPNAYGGSKCSTTLASNRSGFGSARGFQQEVKTSKGGWAKPPKSTQTEDQFDDLPESSDEEWRNKHRNDDTDSDDSF